MWLTSSRATRSEVLGERTFRTDPRVKSDDADTRAPSRQRGRTTTKAIELTIATHPRRGLPPPRSKHCRSPVFMHTITSVARVPKAEERMGELSGTSVMLSNIHDAEELL